MFNGYRSVPRPYSYGYEVILWNSSGTIKSSWYEEEYQEDRYRRNKDVHVVLDFPPNLADLVGSGSLEIGLEVDIQKEEGWVEEVKFSDAIQSLL